MAARFDREVAVTGDPGGTADEERTRRAGFGCVSTDEPREVKLIRMDAVSVWSGKAQWTLSRTLRHRASTMAL